MKHTVSNQIEFVPWRQSHEKSYILMQKLCFNIPCPKTKTLKKSITCVGAKLWNNFANEVRNIDSLDTFRRTIRNMPREFYSF